MQLSWSLAYSSVREVDVLRPVNPLTVGRRPPVRVTRPGVGLSGWLFRPKAIALLRQHVLSNCREVTDRVHDQDSSVKKPGE